jgi:hypothetical protein
VGSQDLNTTTLLFYSTALVVFNRIDAGKGVERLVPQEL